MVENSTFFYMLCIEGKLQAYTSKLKKGMYCEKIVLLKKDAVIAL